MASRRVAGMTQTEFEREAARLLRRYLLLNEAEHGDVSLKRVTVTRKKMTWTVRAKRRTYVRYIAPPGWKPKGEKRR